MYNIFENHFNKLLTKYRKSRNLSLEDLGNKIGKSKATISKYERGEITPDIITILEICNSLNISLSQLFPISNTSKNKFNINPFNSNLVYLYYYVEKYPIISVLEIIEEEDRLFVKLYNGVKDIKKYAEKSSYYYEGELECYNSNGYINLRNCNSDKIILETVQISFNIPWSKDFELTNFFIQGIPPNSVPIIKKGIIAIHPIKDINTILDDLILSKEDVNKIQKDNAWLLENKNYDHFFYDF